MKDIDDANHHRHCYLKHRACSGVCIEDYKKKKNKYQWNAANLKRCSLDHLLYCIYEDEPEIIQKRRPRQ